MKTELKFRKWHKEFEEMIFSENILTAFWMTYEKYPEKYELMICAGIKDKKGQDIYDGDIFKLGAEKEVFEVRFEHGCFMAFKNGKQFSLIGELQICFIDVIWNIHQNPNLL